MFYSNELRIYYLVKKLQYKYRDQIACYVSYNDRVCDADYLSFIIYNSLPIVYPDIEVNLPEFYRLQINRKNQKYRAKKYLDKMFKQDKTNLQFITLTWNDESLKLKDSVRHKYVVDWCRKNCFDYFGNIDYGTLKQREHYHVVADVREFYDQWLHGFMYAKPVNKTSKDIKRIDKYLHKLVNHSGKYTTGKSFHKRKSSKTLVEIFNTDLDKIF